MAEKKACSTSEVKVRGSFQKQLKKRGAERRRRRRRW